MYICGIVSVMLESALICFGASEKEMAKRATVTNSNTRVSLIGLRCILIVIFILAENKFIIEKVIERHSNNGGEAKDAGGFDKIVVEW